MQTQSKRRFTEEEYLVRERAAEYRSEFYGGEITALAGTTKEHSRIIANLVTLLNTALRDHPCHVYTGELRVRVNRNRLYTYPDLVITCGPEEYAENDFDTLLNPLVLIEVLSPATEAYDRGKKFFRYQQLPSLWEYVLVSQEGWLIERFLRQPDGRWMLDSASEPDAKLTLASVPASLGLADLYFKTGVPQEFPLPPDDERPGY